MKIISAVIPKNPTNAPAKVKSNRRVYNCGASSGTQYIVSPDMATIITDGGDISPALTAVSPSINAPTIDNARPKYLGILRLASYNISKSKRTNKISANGVRGRPLVVLTIVIRNFSGIAL